MRILVITNVIPFPPISGAAVRLYNLLRRIAERHQIWLATHLHTPEESQGVPQLQEFCEHVATASLRPRHPLAHVPGLLRYALAGRPLELKFLHSAELARKIRRLLSQVHFDIVQIEESRMALYLEDLPKDAQSKCILTFYDIAFQQAARFHLIRGNLMMKLRTRLYSRMMHRWEPRCAGHFNRCITVSEIDRNLLMAANPRLQVDVIPNGVDTHLYQPLALQETQPSLLFIGRMSYPPSADAALYFCNEILPHIRNAVGEVRVWIVGGEPPPDVVRLSGDGVHVTGRVEDVVPFYERSTVCIVPLRAGGGTRLKILEAMALGRPVVSTTIGCEGLDVVDGQHLLIADSPEQFAEKTVRLLKDRALYERITINARQLVELRYAWDAIAAQMMQIYAQMIE